MSKSSSYSPDNEPREYFRVTSEVNLRYKLCSLDDIDQDKWPENLIKSESQQLMESLRSIESELAPTLRSIGEKNRPLEHYLRSVNKRMDQIAQYLHANNQKAQEHELQTVLISEGGIEFTITKEQFIQINEHLALEITLLPSHTALAVFGRVINLREKDGQQLLGVEFTKVKDIDQQQLAKHVIQQQLHDKRNQLNTHKAKPA